MSQFLLLTDHCVIKTLKPDINHRHTQKNYWKFNADLLNVDEYVRAVKALLVEVINDAEIDTFCRRWEYFKYKVRSLSIKFSKTRSNQQREHEIKSFQEINEYYRKAALSDEDGANILGLQTRLDDLLSKRARGAYVRSRAKWIEQGEKDTSYFFGLERRRQEKNKINTLKVNNCKCSDPKVISEEMYQFFSKLYSPKEHLLPLLREIVYQALFYPEISLLST